MPEIGPRLLAFLLVTAAVGAGCTGGGPAPGSGDEAGDEACNWAARFVDRDAYPGLAEFSPADPPANMSVHRGPHRWQYLPFENRSLETLHGDLRLKRVLHANASAPGSNATPEPARWSGPVPAGFEVEGEQDRVRSHGDDAFVAYVGEDVEATRAGLVDFLGQVTDKNLSTRAAWADRALENVTPVTAGDDPKRVEIVFEYVDSDAINADAPPGDLTLTSLYEDLAAEAPPTFHREPGVLVAAFDDWWWIFEIEHVSIVDTDRELRVDRHGQASFMVSDRGHVDPGDRSRMLEDTYEALGLGSAPNVTFEPVGWGPACPEPTPPPSHG